MAAPINTAEPVVAGTAQQGVVLVTDDGLWTGDLSGYTYTWQRETAPGADTIIDQGTCAATGSQTGVEVIAEAGTVTATVFIPPGESNSDVGTVTGSGTFPATEGLIEAATTS